MDPTSPVTLFLNSILRSQKGNSQPVTRPGGSGGRSSRGGSFGTPKKKSSGTNGKTIGGYPRNWQPGTSFKEEPGRREALRSLGPYTGNADDLLNRREQESQIAPPSLSDILAQYGDGSSSIASTLSGFANQRADTERRGGLADKAIAGFYDKAIGQINTGADQLNTTLGANNDAAAAQAQGLQGALTGANDSAKAQRDAILQNLGLSGSVDDTNRTADVAARKGDAAAYSAADMARLRSDQNTAVTSQRTAATSSGLRQAEERTLNQSNMQSILAELADREQQERASAAQSAKSQALQMYSLLRGDYESDRAYGDSRSDRLDDRAYNEAQENEQFRREQMLAMQGNRADPTLLDQMSGSMGNQGAQNAFDAFSSSIGAKGLNTAVKPTVAAYLQQVRQTPQYTQGSPSQRRQMENYAIQFFNQNKLGG